MTDSNRRDFLRLAAAAGAVGANAVPGLIQKALAIPANRETGTHQGRQAHRHPDAGEPLVRPLLRHA